MNNHSAILITHGTDTLAWTHAAVRYAVKKQYREYCYYWHSDSYPHHSDADVHKLSPSYAIRGGGWKSPLRLCRLICRVQTSPTERRDTLGFRLAL